MSGEDELRHLLEQQSGLATRRQLRSAGLSDAAIRWRAGRNWRLVLPGVVATFTGSLTWRQRLVAAQLYGGEDSVLSSWTAAEYHGVESAHHPLIRLVVPDRRSARSAAFVTVTRTGRPDVDVWSRPPLTFASRGRCIIEAAREVGSQEHATALVIEAVQRRLVTLEMLRHELEASGQRGSRRARVALVAAESGVWSMPEHDLLELVSTSAVLPEAWPNPELSTPDGLVLPSPDLWFDEVGLAVQVHSRRHHEGPQEWDATVMGDGVLGEHAILVLGVTPRFIADRPRQALARIERTYLSLVGRARPQVVARPRSLIVPRTASTKG